MNPTQFIKEYGTDVAEEVTCLDMEELEQILKAHERIKKLGGLVEAKKLYESLPFGSEYLDLQDDISKVEDCL